MAAGSAGVVWETVPGGSPLRGWFGAAGRGRSAKLAARWARAPRMNETWLCEGASGARCSHELQCLGMHLRDSGVLVEGQMAASFI